MKEQIDIFFGLLDKLDNDMQDAAKLSDVFDVESIYYTIDSQRDGDAELCTPYKHNQLCSVLKHEAHNSRVGTYDVESVILWRNGTKHDTYWEDSEKLKIVHEANGYQFALLRTEDMVKEPTDTIWHRHFRYKDRDTWYTHKLALIKADTNEIVHATPRRWEFEQLCLNQNRFEEYIECPVDFFEQYEPFKLFFIKCTDALSEMSDSMDFSIDRPYQPREESYYRDLIKTEPEAWYVCYAIGLRNSESFPYKDRNATWWYVYSPDGEPTKNQAIRQAIDFIRYYREHSFVELVQKFIADRINVNGLPIETVERMRYAAGKLSDGLARIFGYSTFSHLKQEYGKVEECFMDRYNKDKYMRKILFKYR